MKDDLLALKRLKKKKDNRRLDFPQTKDVLLLLTDDTTAVAYTNDMGGSHSMVIRLAFMFSYRGFSETSVIMNSVYKTLSCDIT